MANHFFQWNKIMMLIFMHHQEEQALQLKRFHLTKYD